MEVPGLIAHEWIELHGGSENVLEAIAALFPDADMVAPWTNAPERFPNREVRQLWLSQSPLRRHKALALPALAAAWRNAVPLDKKYDWILASSHSFAHHIRPRGASAHAPKLVYAYTPARYVWTPELDERGSGLFARAASLALRPIDRARAKEPQSIAVISEYVADRARAAWRREAEVIYPPVQVTLAKSVADWRTRLAPDELAFVDNLPSEFVLGASRFIPYKRLDLVIDAAEAAGLPAVLAGSGPEEARLREKAAAAGVDVHFVIAPSNALLFSLYQRALVFVFPPIEDFGIMPIEAMALGTPVVANRIGGSAETVSDGYSGIHFDKMDAASLGAAVRRAAELSPADAAQWSEKFATERFDGELVDWVNRSI